MIEIKSLTHTYKNNGVRTDAIKDINLTIPDGKITAIIGHTGSGKSTLIQHLNGLLKPDSGDILLDGISIYDSKKISMKEVRRKVGLVFQYPEYQLFEETVYKDIAFAPKNYGCTKEEIDERVHLAAKAVGLKESNLQKSPFELSGGQKRKAAIAGVLAMKPEVLVLDEPAAGLDPFGREKILYEIGKICSEEAISVVLVSHSMEEVATCAHKIAVMHGGEIKMTGSPSEIFTKVKELEQMRLDIPQITKILNELRLKGISVPEDIFSVKEAANWILKNIPVNKGN
ncbi:MAG: energy-coupling factor transporter ATPase [Clostridia bacterium]|nr:energy-coupling factor transporter ATPase [Clostridia bacterium]